MCSLSVIEADSLGRAGEVGDRGRELDELLEVDDEVVAAAANRAQGTPELREDSRITAERDADDARREAASLQKRAVLLQREEVDLGLGQSVAKGGQHREQHHHVAQPVALDHEDTARVRGRRAGVGRRGRTQGGLGRSSEPRAQPRNEEEGAT
jgi:hypothetical protein